MIFWRSKKRLSREIDDISQSKRGRLIIGASILRGGMIVPPIFAQFKKDYPHIDLKLIEGSNDTLLDFVQTGKADFAFVSAINDDVCGIKLLDERILLAAHTNKRLKTSGKSDASALVDLRDVKEAPFILLTPGQGIRIIADRIFGDYGFRPKIAYETKSLETAFRFVEAEQGYTFVVESLYHLHRKTTAVNCYPLDQGNYVYPLFICYRKGTYLSKSMLHFVNLTKKIMRDDKKFSFYTSCFRDS